jgi:hypothetical protein
VNNARPKLSGMDFIYISQIIVHNISQGDVINARRSLYPAFVPNELKKIITINTK